MNPLDLIKQFGNVQERMKEVQEKLKGLSVKGTAGGDMVQIDMNGHMEVLDVHISKAVVDPQDISMLEDLIKAAYTDALVKIKERIGEEASSLTGGLNLPPGMLGT
ncbi:MAG TPA: YbaB/EbfC family nucleoid-associated protein [bacterium]|nr:YbaB/EbfC family nucleoid-associated protein [bacterium]